MTTHECLDPDCQQTGPTQPDVLPNGMPGVITHTADGRASILMNPQGGH